ncbi:hypothetical protein RMSM_05498 [Rhodopirellula maiorica SM1]|uniref:Uncharacterized protein n=1 Tax=Rhodopirellula maiorica SM1 TaxID=1265738 RepID=M5RDX4_9BACT|nr:hypothetical protein [Rhodopirellula maiorica]EMI17585.1 hypothetical protein RMSM_05498 [Rhodopirellula maiorica SM1]
MKPKKKKAICKWDRSEIEDLLPLLLAEAHSAKYVCKKCGRTAAEKAYLCKPVADKEIK